MSDLLRYTLESKDTQEVSLRRELEFIKNYLAIEQVRFSDRLQVEISVDPEVLDAPVPNLILQPLVENALEHGLAPHPGSGRLCISAGRKNGMLEMEVKDNGVGMVAGDERTRGAGIGITNTRARLQHLYGSGYYFDVSNKEEGGVVSTIRIPFHKRSEGRTALS